MTKEYCVYMHECPNGKKYIGITKQNPKIRWANGHGYDTQFFGKAIRKYGWENITHTIMASHLSQEEAESLEMELIRLYNTMNPILGYNCDLGGKGSPGRSLTDEQREHHRAITKAMWENPDKRELLLEHLKKVSEGNKGRPKPKEAIEKTREALSIPILQYTKECELVAEHKSLMEAARSLGLKGNSLICRVCKLKTHTAYGFYWRYKDDPITDDEKKELLKPKVPLNAKMVTQLT